jgi:hypothetical protein
MCCTLVFKYWLVRFGLLKQRQSNHYPDIESNEDIEDLFGDFVAHYGTRFPDIVDSILLQMSAMDLEQCRLVSRAWKMFIDHGRLLEKLPVDGRIWAGKNRLACSHKVKFNIQGDQ